MILVPIIIIIMFATYSFGYMHGMIDERFKVKKD